VAMSKIDDVISFLELWQAMLKEATTSGYIYDDSQQVNFLLRALPTSWSTFVTTQGGINNLTSTTLLSNVL